MRKECNCNSKNVNYLTICVTTVDEVTSVTWAEEDEGNRTDARRSWRW